MKSAGIVPALFAALAIGAMASTPARAITALSDNFDGEGPPGSTLNFNAFANWDVIAPGTVDLVNNGDFFVPCVTGKCVDLDGSTTGGGLFRTKEMFDPGTYIVKFSLAGNHRNDTLDTVDFAFGDYSESFVRARNDPHAEISRTITLLVSGFLSFQDQGNDLQGIILDNVSVALAPPPGDAPVPAALPLFAGGLGVMAFLARRRKRRAQAAA